MAKRTYTCDQLADAVESADSLAGVLRRIGLVPRGGNYETVKQALIDCGIDGTRLRSLARSRRGVRWDYSAAEVRDAAAQSGSLAELMRRLGRSPTSAGYSHVRRVLAEASIDTSHFGGQGWRRGVQGRIRPRTPLSELLVAGRLTNSSKLRERLIEEGLKQRKCERCGRTNWMGQPIPLELEHVNGIRSDNRIENLRLLCPNCHAQTPTYRGRNIGRTGG